MTAQEGDIKISLHTSLHVCMCACIFLTVQLSGETASLSLEGKHLTCLTVETVERAGIAVRAPSRHVVNTQGAWSAGPRSHLSVVLGGTISHRVHPGESRGSPQGCVKSQGQSWDSDLTRVTPSFPPALRKPFVSNLGLSIASSALTKERYISSQQLPNRKEIQACSFN